MLILTRRIRGNVTVLAAILILFAWRSAIAVEGDEIDRVSNACAIGALALSSVAETLAYDIDAVDSDQGREAFLAQAASFDKQYHEMRTFKATWLLSLNDALTQLRAQLDINASAAKGSDVPAARIEWLRRGTWEGASSKLQRVCMFRAGKLVGQGKLRLN
jgi:hypothetical protein